jgi:hypothetical protein
MRYMLWINGRYVERGPCRFVPAHPEYDTLVPLEKNSGALAQRYRQLGGVMTLKVVKGQGHNAWPGFFQCQELVDFIVAHAKERNTN